jgi:hypothetical protein
MALPGCLAKHRPGSSFTQRKLRSVAIFSPHMTLADCLFSVGKTEWNQLHARTALLRKQRHDFFEKSAKKMPLKKPRRSIPSTTSPPYFEKVIEPFSARQSL